MHKGEGKVRLASVGLGRWARVLANGAQRGDAVQLFSCFSRDEERRAKFAAGYGIPQQASRHGGLRSGGAVPLVGCCSRDEERRAKFAEEYGIPKTASSYEELLADPDVEGII